MNTPAELGHMDNAALRAELLKQQVRIAAMASDAELLREANQQLLLNSLDAYKLHDAAELANARQNEFLAMLAHELRNLLAPISMANAMMAKLPLASPELLDLNAIIQRQVAHLSRLLDDLLDAARIHSDKLSLLRGRSPLPQAPGHTQACVPDAQVPVPRRILVVEDNLDANDTLARLLAAEGHHVTAAYDGIAGLALARKQEFDVMLCDIGLPGLDGLQLIAQLRATVGAHIPFAVAISGYGRTEDRERAASAGYGQYFVKPVEVDALLTLISSEVVSRFIAGARKQR